MDYFQKNRQNILVIVASLILLLGLVIWLLQRDSKTTEDITASVYPTSLSTGDQLSFEDKSDFGKSRKWIFGDGYETTGNKGQHAFAKPGYYQVTLLIDNKISKTFPVLVSSAPAALAEESSPTTIDAPSQAMQLENVLFRAVSPDAKIFTWKFGETGNIDSKDRIATYAFKNPGNYVITLFTDKDQEPIVHQIKILPAYPVMPQEELGPPPPTEEEVFSKINDDFRQHLQQIAYGNNFNYHYNYLLSTYLCNKDNVSTMVNEQDKTFYYYCTGLQFDKNNLIQEVKTTVDTGQNCITKIEVKQSKQ